MSVFARTAPNPHLRRSHKNIDTYKQNHIIIYTYKWSYIIIAIHPEYIINDKLQKKAVVIKFNEWKNILSEMEELEDIRAYDIAKADTDDEIISFEQAIMEIK